MPQPIARLYANQTAATSAVAELKARGFQDDAIHLVAAADQAPAGTAIQESITNAGISPEHAKIYADGVHHGQALVIVNPPFGAARTATDILQSFDPVEVDLPAETATASTAGWNSATPFSSWLGYRVLLSDPAPLSNYMNWSILKAEPESSQTLDGIRKQSDDPAPFSSKIGMPTIADEPAPLSSKFGWQTLWSKAAPLSERLGWRTLSDDPAPLSSKLGWSSLSSNPTPLSSALGWSSLSSNPTPLSSALGWSVLSKN